MAPEERPVRKFTGSFVRLYTPSMAAKALAPANRPMMMPSAVV
ncbi:MAG: hypothetical protein UFE80_03920 [Christensenellales bacterium]|nr:hypothetical protein [Christensenellales bacterium]